MRIAKTAIIAASLAILAAGTAQGMAGDGHVMFMPDAIKWQPAPPVLPAGAQVVALQGDPMKPGFFTVRMLMPAGYKIPPHFHSIDENITVLQGSFNMGMGDKFDEKKGHEMPAGTFMMLKKGSHHYAWTNDETIIQLHGMGPFDITYINPADDPSKKVKKPAAKTK